MKVLVVIPAYNEEANIEKAVDVQFDGDGQHDASCIKLLVEQIEKGSDLVIGSEPESIVAAKKAGLSISEVQVVMHERQGGVSSINPIPYALSDWLGFDTPSNFIFLVAIFFLLAIALSLSIIVSKQQRRFNAARAWIAIADRRGY